MKVIRDLSALAHVQPEVRALTEQRIRELSEYVDDVFAELTRFIVVEPGDATEPLDTELGFAVLANRFDGIPFGADGFTPCWDVLEEHAKSYELVYVLSDDGCGVTVLVLKQPGVPEALLAMCSRYATAEQA